jgi:hypothetical protein
MTGPLYHYTCSHGLVLIEQDCWTLRPNGLVEPSLLWLTDLDQPDREGLGLTMRVLKCDRTRHRFIVPQPLDVTPWVEARRGFRPTYVESLEKAKGARPEHWFVTRTPQLAQRAAA